MDKGYEDEPISSSTIFFYFLSFTFSPFCVISVAKRTIFRISVLFTADCLQLAFNWKLRLGRKEPIDWQTDTRAYEQQNSVIFYSKGRISVN